MNREHIKYRKSLRWLSKNCIWITTAFVVAICIGIYIFFIANAPVLVSYFYGELEGDKLANAGVFGDSAGAVNALFSAFAFIGVIIAIWLQAKELKLQRIELKDTRRELAGQKREFEVQNETLKRQRFENTFFQMLSLQEDIVKDLYLSYNAKVSIVTYKTEGGVEEVQKEEQRQFIGREIFRFTFEGNSEYQGIKEIINTPSFEEGMKEYTNSVLPTYYDHYFRHLYRIIKFVDESKLLPNSYKEKYSYTSIVRAQLSRYELVWLFYNCLSPVGSQKFKPLIERYALLKNIRDAFLVNEDHLDKYEPGAYEKKSDE